MGKKNETKRFGSLALRWLKARGGITGNRNRHRHRHRNQNPNPDPDQNLNLDSDPSNDLIQNMVESSEAVHDGTDQSDVSSLPHKFDEEHNGETPDGESDGLRRMESSLKRCSTISNNKKDTTFNQAENTRKDKLNPTPVSAAYRKMGNKKATRFRKFEIPYEYRCLTPYSRAFARHVAKKGVLRVSLSNKAAKLVWGGLAPGKAVHAVGLQNAFTRRTWNDGTLIYVSLREKNGILLITKSKHFPDWD